MKCCRKSLKRRGEPKNVLCVIHCELINPNLKLIIRASVRLKEKKEEAMTK